MRIQREELLLQLLEDFNPTIEEVEELRVFGDSNGGRILKEYIRSELAKYLNSCFKVDASNAPRELAFAQGANKLGDDIVELLEGDLEFICRKLRVDIGSIEKRFYEEELISE